MKITSVTLSGSATFGILFVASLVVYRKWLSTCEPGLNRCGSMFLPFESCINNRFLPFESCINNRFV